ncbi:DUF3592 domain-containing protein [Pseudochryseolinea flava]|uniref:DUF3592 domain-containing protein n=1 Tax=Pseudochryseolinea flava TaxID=2059302 RepID=A0A364XWR2_9BACT|nr:DUF3592 domain-containing protein [Pseudochryseolinea flava]RAV98654.1 hypothetical protein DQQ10_23255 [Pseudochryseolinea flava]
MLVFAALCIVGLVALYLDHSRLVREENKFTAMVVRIEKDEEKESPVFEYQKGTTTVEFKTSRSFTAGTYHVGDTVVLFIDPEKNSNVVFDTFSDRWLGFLFMIAFTAMLIFLSFLLLKGRRTF